MAYVQREDDNYSHELSAAPSSSSTQQLTEPVVLSRKVKLLTAAAIFYGNVTFGCCVNTYGPVLTNFQRKFGTDDATISRVFTICTGGLLLGALSSGFLYKYANRQLSVVAFLGGMAAIMFINTYCPTLTTFFIAAAVLGVFSGFYASAQFVWIMEMMQKDCPPYVQSQHFFYALGAIISTLIMAPFLDAENDEVKKNKGQGTVENLTFSNNTNQEKSMSADSSSKLFIPYTIVGCMLVLAMFCQIILFMFFRYRPPPPEEVNSSDKKEPDHTNNTAATETKSPWLRARIVVLCCLFFAALQGMEICVMQFIPKFAQNSNLSLSESESTYILTGLTVSYAAARFICILIVFKVPCQLLLCGNLVLTLTANILLTFWANNSLPILWAASITFGLGFSSMYACFSAFIERYLQVTNLIGAMIMVSSSGISAAYPLIIGNFIEKNPVVLGYTTFFSITICTIAFAATSYFTHKDKTRY